MIQLNPRYKAIFNLDNIDFPSLRKERAHTEDYLQNAAAKKKELDKEQNASFNV